MASTINEAEVYRMMDEIAGLKAKLAQQEQITNDISKAYDEKLSQAYVSGGIKKSTQRIIKEWQLFAGERATENALIAEQLEFTVRVAQEWQVRAEAAENDLRELRENTLLALGHNRPALEDIMKLQHPPNGHRLKQELAAALARAEAAEKRVAELEARLAELVTGPGGFNERADIIKELRAQLAAQAWRPVTEPPTRIGFYLLYDPEYKGVYYSCWHGGWINGHNITPSHWRPLPAPPIDPPAPA